MSGSFLGGVAGATVGFFVSGGNPAGAQWGWNIGVIVGGLLTRPGRKEIQGPQLSDLKVQDSSYGRPIPVVWGTFRLAGNIIWMGPVIERRHTQREGGKGGGGGTKTVTYSYHATYAVALCEGPIRGVRRIWANGKLLYDNRVSASVREVASSHSLGDGGRMTVYRGTEAQMPDPSIEAHEGSGNVPAHRGMAYVVFRDLPLEDYGNHLPQLSFEVVTGESHYRQEDFAVWHSPHRLGTLFWCHRMMAEGGFAAARGWAWSFEGLKQAQLSPYGVVELDTVGQTGTFPSRGYADEDGALVNSSGEQMWVPLPAEPLNPFWRVERTGIPLLGAANSQTSFVRERGVTWYTSYYGLGNYPIYRSENGTVTTSQDANAPRTILGVSASYLYVAQSDEAIRRYDKVTLAYVDTVYSGSVGYPNTGYVDNDTLIYTASGGSGVYEINLATGTRTRIIHGRPGGGAIFPSTYTFRKVGGGAFVYTYESSDRLHAALIWEAFPDGDALLSDIVSDVCERAGLKPTQYNVAQLDDKVSGYALTQLSSAKDSIAALLQIHYVDVTDGGGQLRFVKRGGPVLGEIDPDDLVGSEAESAEDSIPITQVRTQELELPAELSISYLSQNQDHQSNTQSAYRHATQSVHKVQLQAAAVFDDSEARGRTEVLLAAALINRSKFTFRTPRDYIAYEPSDVVVLENPDDGQTWPVRITQKSLGTDGVIDWEALLEDPGLYPDGTEPPPTGATTLHPPQTVPYAGPSVLRVLDGPPLRDTDTLPALYLAATGLDDSWPGAAVEVSRDNGQTWSVVTALFEPATIGTATHLGDFHSGNLPDEINAVTVTLVQGELESTDHDGLLGAVNAAYIGDELVFFRDAELIADRTYRLSGFLRGRQGTEWAMADHADGERFVLLDPATLYRMTVDVNDIGRLLRFYTTTLGMSTGTPSSENVEDACVKPLAPVHLHATHGSTDAADDITVRWVRQARVNNDWRNGTDVPLDQSAETYQLEVLSGSTVVRTVSVSAATAWVYAAADITADGFSGGQTVTLRVSQNGDHGVQGRTTTTSLVR